MIRIRILTSAVRTLTSAARLAHRYPRAVLAALIAIALVLIAAAGIAVGWLIAAAGVWELYAAAAAAIGAFLLINRK
jgi:membrane protein YdbS with pleckstrin-like domain